MKKLVMATTTSLALILSGCQTTNPYTGEKETSNAALYGVGAAVVCGLIGATRNSKSARNAAAGCGLIGAGVGAYMDAQEAELRQELEGTGVRVQRDGDRIKLIMPGNITFDSNKYLIKGEFTPVLDSVAKVLYKFTDTNLRVSGHTDSTGKKSYNQMLSEKRADSVANYLMTKEIPRARLISRGYADELPVAGNDTAAGRAQNRRVELDIIADTQG